MTKYKIIPDGLKAYGAEVASQDRFLSVRGFATELEAAAREAEQPGTRSFRYRRARSTLQQ
jgi:hypothetical protein